MYCSPRCAHPCTAHCLTRRCLACAPVPACAAAAGDGAAVRRHDWRGPDGTGRHAGTSRAAAAATLRRVQPICAAGPATTAAAAAAGQLQPVCAGGAQWAVRARTAADVHAVSAALEGLPAPCKCKRGGDAGVWVMRQRGRCGCRTHAAPCDCDAVCSDVLGTLRSARAVGADVMTLELCGSNPLLRTNALNSLTPPDC